jgi:hypothetical protein
MDAAQLKRTPVKELSEGLLMEGGVVVFEVPLLGIDVVAEQIRNED